MDPIVADYLREKADALRRHENALRTDAPDSVHQARVAVRKIRSALCVFGADGPAARELDERLQEWGQILGRARDAEVIRESLRTRVNEVMADDGAGEVAELADQLDRRLAEEYEHARTAVVEHLDSPAHVAMLNGLAAVTAPDHAGCLVSRTTPRTDEDRAKWLVAAARAAREEFQEKGRRIAAARADDAWHRARRAARRARYAADRATAPATGEPRREARTHAKQLTTAQRRPGMHHDQATLTAWLKREHARSARTREERIAFDILLG